MRFSLLRKFIGRKPQPPLRRQATGFRPCLETLEDRLVPTAGPVTDLTTHMSYATIQTAVNAANPGDTIRVSPGTYNEQVTIDKNTNGVTLDGLTLEGASSASTTINGAGGTTPTARNATLEVTGAQGVTIKGFTVTNLASTPDPNDNLYGIRIDGGGSATITNNHITQVEDSPLGGVQQGVAIDVGRDITGDVTTGSAIISHNVIDNYQKAGIIVDNAGSSATIDHNSVTGAGPTTLIAQNGIEIVRGAQGDVFYNNVSDNSYTSRANLSPNDPNFDEAAGILLYQVGGVTVVGNTASDNGVGIWAYQTTGPTIYGNHVTGSAVAGIDLDTSTTEALVLSNNLSNNGSGVAGDGGIVLVNNSSNNTIILNNSRNNNGDGIFVDSGSTQNSFVFNQLHGNSNFDAEDQSTGAGTAGTDNTWILNRGKTSNPSGLVS